MNEILWYTSIIFTLRKKFFLKRIVAYPTRAPNTNRIHDRTQAVKALNPSTFGEVPGILLKIFVSVRNNVTRRVILPGITSGSIRKLT